MRTTGNDLGMLKLTVITGWLGVLAILGVCGYDAFGVMSAHISTENDAQDAAYAASQSWHTSANITTAYQAAEASVSGKGERVLTQNFTIDTDGTVHLEVRSTARTLVMKRIGPLKKDTIVTVHGDANSVN